eukprot:TRINITY_DN10029_c0_g1_i1.p1 TRINITY_DN10029_c0_g1~~TRINITY_DN10029_c0_g1_i1.p1  ORF type:complete len:204 (+),score=18.46 TRINITY_DN10029_c0_g1_i1:232-843(+)
MGKFQSLLTMKVDEEMNTYEIDSDLRDIGLAIRKLGKHSAGLLGTGLVTGLLRWLATLSAIYLLVLDRTNWRTRMTTALLVPYLFLNLPGSLFSFFRGEVGRWISFIAVVLRLFFPRHFPDWLEMPASLVLLLVVTPNLIAEIRGGIIGIIVSLIIGAYLLTQHIQNAGGIRNAFAERRGVSNTLGIILLFVNPLWEAVKLIF